MFSNTVVLEAEENRKREAAEAARQRRRREIIQQAKDAVVGYYVSGVRVPEDVRAQARQEIERALAAMPLEELPEGEVRESAEGVWRRVTRPVVQAAEEAKRREQEAKRREQEAWRRQEEERQAAREKERQREAARRTRIERGKAYAEGELRGENLEWSDRWDIMREVESALDRQVVGDESQRDLEEIVDGVLDPKLEDLEEKQRAARKRTLLAHGERYAREALSEVEAMDPWARIGFPAKVRRELEAELDGSEDEKEVEDLVEEILDEEFEEE